MLVYRLLCNHLFNKLYLFATGQICEQTIVVDGEIATITLLDTWDCQVGTDLSGLIMKSTIYIYKFKKKFNAKPISNLGFINHVTIIPTIAVLRFPFNRFDFYKMFKHLSTELLQGYNRFGFIC